MEILVGLETVRAFCYAAGVMFSLYLSIEYANRHERAMAAMLGTLMAMHLALLLSIAARFFGMYEVGSRALITPAVLLHTVALFVLVGMEWRAQGLWPLQRRRHVV